MIMFWSFAIGLFIGGFVGVAIMALLNAAGKSDDIDPENKNNRK